MTPETTDVPVSVIEPHERGIVHALEEIWHYRALYYWLTWRDIKVRYKHTWIGLCWALLQPLATVLVYSYAFGLIVRVPTDIVPYPLFLMTGYTIWTLFASIVQAMSTALISNRGLVSKVYFPKLVLLFSSAGIPLMDFVIMLILVVLAGAFSGFGVSFKILLVIPIVFTLLIFAAGVGLWTAILNTQYPDTRFIVPVILQVGVFATPVVYPLALVPAGLKPLMLANPMVALVQSFRWALLGTDSIGYTVFGISLLIGIILLVSAIFVFERHERDLVDAL
jgi:lipopolysaccharide transport system permease protein